MKLGFVGADHEVTGSCHYLEACGKQILIDCGMEQGKDIYVNQDIPVPINQIDYVLLTHAHIDHSGRLPLLYKNGFKGSIISTFATSDLCSIMLRDSAHIQEFEAEWRNRKARRAGSEEYVPLYTTEDALGAISLFHPCDYEQTIELSEGINIRFRDVGHLLGSASIEIWITENDISRKLVFSGDIGNINQPLIKDPQTTSSADYVIMESTYGDRNHKNESTSAESGQAASVAPSNAMSIAVPTVYSLLFSLESLLEPSLEPSFKSFAPPLRGRRPAIVSRRAHHLSARHTIHASRHVGGTGTSGNIWRTMIFRSRGVSSKSSSARARAKNGCRNPCSRWLGSGSCQS